MNRAIKFVILTVLVILGLGILLEHWYLPCLFKKITGIPCPGCGLTRGILALLSFDFRTSWSYHILAFPVLILLIVVGICLVYDWIRNTKWTEKLILQSFERYDLGILILLAVSWVTNIVRGV